MARFSKIDDERGAITIADVLIVLVSAVFIGAVAVPFMLGQQADMNKRAAALAAKSIAVEVQTSLITNADDTVPEPVVISHNPGSQILNIPLATVRGTEAADTPFTLGSQIRLVPADPSTADLAGANIIYSRDNYCIAVSSSGQIAFHNQSGPTDRCPAVSPNSNPGDNTSEEIEGGSANVE